MLSYQFQAEDFALSDEGIHLLRSRFNFKTIDYDQVKSASIAKGIEIKRPIIILVIGIGLLAFAIAQTISVYRQFIDPKAGAIYIEMIVLPVIPGLLGLYCLYATFKKGPILKLNDGKTIHKLRLRTIFKTNRSTELKHYLSQKLGPRLSIEMTT